MKNPAEDIKLLPNIQGCGQTKLVSFLKKAPGK